LGKRDSARGIDLETAGGKVGNTSHEMSRERDAQFRGADSVGGRKKRCAVMVEGRCLSIFESRLQWKTGTSRGKKRKKTGRKMIMIKETLRAEN